MVIDPDGFFKGNPHSTLNCKYIISILTFGAGYIYSTSATLNREGVRG